MIVLKYKWAKGNTDFYYLELQPAMTEENEPTIQKRQFEFNLKREKDGFRFTSKKEILTAGELFMAVSELTNCGYYPIFATILNCQITAEKCSSFRSLECAVNAQLMNRGEEPLDSKSL